MEDSHHIEVKEDHKGSNKEDKAKSLEKVFLVTNFILELPSVVFDQLSSVHKPQYALLSMLMSFTVLIVSIIDLVQKGRKQKVSWMKRGLIPWFYYPHPNSKLFGTLPEIIGLVCAIFQCFFASISYAFLSWNGDNPININVWPIIFSFGLLCSGLSGNPSQRRPNPHERRLNRAEEFSLAEIAVATDDFSPQNKVGGRSFWDVYIGKLVDDRLVIIKRWVTNHKRSVNQAQDKAFESELEILSRLHHKHMVRLIGYCIDGNERLLVFDCLQNGALCLHLYDKKHNEMNSNVINSWKMRIKIALDAARGIEYLHSYAVPPIIHRDIRSSNILLDADWTVRISDLGFSLMASEIEGDDKSEIEGDDKSVEAAGTVGYVDPEFYSGRVMTSKSDVYSFGVVLLELLTGKRAIFKNDDNEGTPTSVVDFAVPKIMAGKLNEALDTRVALCTSVSLPPGLNEAEAVELLAYTALHCVNLEGKNRPTMTAVVANLERSLALCVGSSSGSGSIED